MPSLSLIIASGASQRRVLEETVESLGKKGYTLSGRQEGGEWVSLLSENMSGGLFDENRMVVVEGAALLGALPVSLSSMIEADAPVVILLVYDTEPTKFIPKEILKKCTVIRAEEFPRWPRERQAWVAGKARKIGLTMDYDAITLMVELLEDPEEIRSQLAALYLLKKAEPVKTADVEAFCLDDGSGNLLKLLDSLCNGNAVTALKNLRAISSGGELFPTITALHNRMRMALYAAEYPSDRERFSNALGARKYAWGQASGAARRFGAPALANFVTGLIKINMEEKSGRGAGWYSLELLLLQLLAPGR